MPKKVICLLIAVMLMMPVCPVAQAASKPTITVSSCEAKQGETIELSVSIKYNPGINTFALGFEFDNAKLKLMDVAITEKLGGQFVYKNKAIWFNTKDSKYNGKMLNLKFKVLNTGQGGKTNVTITYSPGDISNSEEKNVNCDIVAGVVTIKEEQAKESWLTKILDFLKRVVTLLKNLFN